VDIRSGAAGTAAARLARLPWRRLAAPEDAPPARNRGWVGGLEEASALLLELTGIHPQHGSGLGGVLPWVAAGEAIVLCGAPIAVGSSERQGVDGAYRLTEGAVLREAGGRMEELLRLEEPSSSQCAMGFDLLWFGSAERYLVRNGVVEIEDLFAKVVAPADRAWMERVLLRGRRVEPGFLRDVELEASTGAATIEVRRRAELVGPGWEDPRRLIGVHGAVEGVRGDAEELEVRLLTGERVGAVVSGLPGGWEVRFAEGRLPWARLWARLEDGAVVYGAEPLADPRDPAVRTRWAFDLMSDLVELGGE